MSTLQINNRITVLLAKLPGLPPPSLPLLTLPTPPKNGCRIYHCRIFRLPSLPLPTLPLPSLSFTIYRTHRCRGNIADTWCPLNAKCTATVMYNSIKIWQHQVKQHSSTVMVLQNIRSQMLTPYWITSATQIASLNQFCVPQCTDYTRRTIDTDLSLHYNKYGTNTSHVMIGEGDIQHCYSETLYTPDVSVATHQWHRRTATTLIWHASLAPCHVGQSRRRRRRQTGASQWRWVPCRASDLPWTGCQSRRSRWGARGIYAASGPESLLETYTPTSGWTLIWCTRI